MDKKKVLILIERSIEILEQQAHAIKHDSDYPISDDLADIKEVKSNIQRAERELQK